jgi:vancomycin resistance protein YoaR
MQANNSDNHISIKKLFHQSLAVLAIGTTLFLITSLVIIGIYQVWYAGRIFPGITINEVGVGGMTREEAALYLNGNFQLAPSGKVTLWYLNTPIEVETELLGIKPDLAASVIDAYNFGRRGSVGSWFAFQLSGNFSPRNIPATITFDQNKAYALLEQIAQQYDQPTLEANLYMQGTQVMSQMGQTGNRLDVAASLERIGRQIEELNLEQIVLPVTETTPQILDASPYANTAQQILNQPLNLYLPTDQPDSNKIWSIDPQELAPMLTFEKSEQNGETQFIPQLKEDYLNAYLEEISRQIEIKTENPRFYFDDNTGELVLITPGTNGRTIDLDSTRASMQTALANGESSTGISIHIQEPEISDSVDGAELGITEWVHTENSYFYGSDEARIQNIETAAGQFHGLLVPPGATFSMAEAMGEISLDNGYAEALIIYNGQTIEGVGGGVCQVSTTLFRAAFFAGFPITERHPHAYRVSYYEKTAGNQRNNNLAGLDATVFIPLIDLKFVNDTPYWLLMETYIDRPANRLTWKFYSTSDGRTVEYETTGPTNIEEPEKPDYRENPELSKDEIEQVEWEADGADVLVERMVYKDGSVWLQDSFATHYEPWRAVYEYGPGTSGIPKDEDNGEEKD